MQDKPNMDEMDPKNIVHDGADQDEVNHVGSVAQVSFPFLDNDLSSLTNDLLQVQPDAATLMPKKAANLSSEVCLPIAMDSGQICCHSCKCTNTDAISPHLEAFPFPQPTR